MSDTAAEVGEDFVALATKDEPEILSWDSRARRLITIYLPLSLFIIVLLFPFYWMAITAVKPDYEMYDYKKFNPFWVHSPTFESIRKLLFETEYPRWLLTTMGIATAATFLSVAASVLAAYAIERLRFRGAQHVGLAIYLAYLVHLLGHRQEVLLFLFSCEPGQHTPFEGCAMSREQNEVPAPCVMEGRAERVINHMKTGLLNEKSCFGKPGT